MVNRSVGMRTGVLKRLEIGITEISMAGGLSGMKMESLPSSAIIGMERSMGNGGNGMRMEG
jgi:hypothetical protein